MSVAFKPEPSLNSTPTLYFEPKFPMLIINTEKETLVVPKLVYIDFGDDSRDEEHNDSLQPSYYV